MCSSDLLVEGTATYNNETGSYDVSEGADYAIVSFSESYSEAKTAIEALEVVKTEGYDKDTVLALIATAQEKVNALTSDSTTSLIEKLQLLSSLVSGEDVESSANPETLYDEIIEALAQYAYKAYVFNLNNVDSPLYFDYTSLYEYDSNLPSKFSSNYANYVPFESLNNASSLWYTKSSLTIDPYPLIFA